MDQLVMEEHRICAFKLFGKLIYINEKQQMRASRTTATMGRRITTFRLFGADIEIDQEPAMEEEKKTAITRPAAIKRPRLRPPADQVLPDEYRDFIASQGADVEGNNGLTLVFSRTLTKTDMTEHHGRLSMPRNQIKCNFLTAEEEALVRQKRDNQCTQIPVTVVDPSLSLHHMSLARWNYVEGEKRSWWYALTNSWTKLAEDNKLSQGDAIQVWSFRFKPGGGLGFVIHKVQPPPPASTTTNTNTNNKRRRRG